MSPWPKPLQKQPQGEDLGLKMQIGVNPTAKRPQKEGLGGNPITRGWKRRWGRAAAQNLSANSPRERI